MALLSTRGLSGQIGKQLVFKAVKGKTVVSAYAESRKKEGSELQKLFRDCFKRAQKRANRDKRKSEIMAKCTSFLKEGQSLYHFLMGLYHREEILMMKNGENEYKSIEVLLSGEPRRRKEVKQVKDSKMKKQLLFSATKPVSLRREVTKPFYNMVMAKTEIIPNMEMWMNRTFYGGWVSTYSS